MDEFLIQGGKVSIRNKRVSDAEKDHGWRCDPELARLDGATPLRMGFDEYLRQFKQELEHENSWSRRFSIDTIDGKHIGNCMYYDVDFFRGSAELGILVGDRNHWSGGYGSEAVKLLLYHMFTEMPMKKVYLHTLDWNHRAQRAFEKCGFKLIRPVKRGGLDFFFMELKKERWAELQQEEEDLATKAKAKEKSAS